RVRAGCGRADDGRRAVRCVGEQGWTFDVLGPATGAVVARAKVARTDSGRIPEAALSPDGRALAIHQDGKLFMYELPAHLVAGGPRPRDPQPDPDPPQAGRPRPAPADPAAGQGEGRAPP